MSTHVDAGTRKGFEVWIFDGRAPELLCHAATLADARTRWSHSRHAAIFGAAGEVVDSKRGADRERLAAIEAARAGRMAPVKQTRPLPRTIVTAFMPERSSEPPVPPVAASPAPALVAPAVEVERQVAPAAPKPTKPTRPAATRPPLPRRRVLAPVVAAPVEAAPVAPAQALPARESVDAAEPKVAPFERLLDQISVERDTHRDRADGAEHRGEQLRGEVEGLTSDLTVARRDLAMATIRWTEVAAERDELRELLSLALATGLAAATEARAETVSVLRQSGELSRQLGALRDEHEQLRATPPGVASTLDEAAILRVATRAAHLAVRSSRENQALRALAESVGGVEALTRLVANVQNLLRGWQR